MKTITREINLEEIELTFQELVNQWQQETRGKLFVF